MCEIKPAYLQTNKAHWCFPLITQATWPSYQSLCQSLHILWGDNTKWCLWLWNKGGGYMRRVGTAKGMMLSMTMFHTVFYIPELSVRGIMGYEEKKQTSLHCINSICGQNELWCVGSFVTTFFFFYLCGLTSGSKPEVWARRGLRSSSVGVRFLGG